MAEWLVWWTSIGVKTPLSDWKVVGSNPTASISRIGFFIQERNVNVPILRRFISISHLTRSPCGQFVAVCYCCKKIHFIVFLHFILMSDICVLMNKNTWNEEAKYLSYNNTCLAPTVPLIFCYMTGNQAKLLTSPKLVDEWICMWKNRIFLKNRFLNFCCFFVYLF